jgi:hypothetical protein
LLVITYTRDVLFNEPQGRPNSLVQFGASLTFLCVFVYAWSVGSAEEVSWVLFLVVGTALSGIAESLPENRRQAAGVLRLSALVVLVSMLVILIATPELFIN